MPRTDIDHNLLRRCVAEEPGAWEEFVDRFLGLFIHVIRHTAHARSVHVGREDVDDLCAEIFLTLVANDYAVLRRFRGRSSLATYLAVVARRIAVHELARRSKAAALGHVDAHGAARPHRDAGPSPQQRVENRDEVRKMLDGLSDTDAEVVRQFHLEGRSYREISDRLGIPENTIGSLLSRARSKMRERKVGS